MCDCVRVCVAFISKGIHFPMGRRVYLFLMPLLLWIGTDRLWQSCCARSRCICSEILLLLFLLSCLFPLISHLSRSPHLSAPSLPLSPTRRADCVWGPQAEESSPGAGPHWEDPAPAWTCGAAARTHAASGERWVNAHLHEPPHTSPPPQPCLLTLLPFAFHFLRSCLLPSDCWCLRRWHLLLILTHGAAQHSPITSFFFIAEALRWPITERLLGSGPDP